MVAVFVVVADVVVDVVAAAGFCSYYFCYLCSSCSCCSCFSVSATVVDDARVAPVIVIVITGHVPALVMATILASAATQSTI